jgi:hypothetical protein
VILGGRHCEKARREAHSADEAIQFFLCFRFWIATSRLRRTSQ